MRIGMTWTSLLGKKMADIVVVDIDETPAQNDGKVPAAFGELVLGKQAEAQDEHPVVTTDEL